MPAQTQSTLSTPAKGKAELINELRHTHALKYLLAMAGMARSTWYNHSQAFNRPDKYAEIRQRVSEIYHYHKGRYDYRRVTDVIEFTVSRQKLYLSPVIDLFNGEVISHVMSERPVMTRVSTMLDKALAKLNPGDTPV